MTTVETALNEIDKAQLKILFPFEYVGGGFFRKRGVSKGTSAEMLHGEEVITYLYKAMKRSEAIQ